MEKFPTTTLVVAAALQDGAGCWLMHRRPPGKHHADLWEFPGGKVEHGETPLEALVREMAEETGLTLDPAALVPAGFAWGQAGEGQSEVVILLYTARRWEGQAVSLEGGELGWFTPEAIAKLAKPPLDEELAAHLFGNPPRSRGTGIAKRQPAPYVPPSNARP